jgi:chemotaxis protein MotA
MKFTFSSFLGFMISLMVLLTGSADTVGVIKLTESLPSFLKIPFLDFASFFVVIGGMLSGLFVMYPAATVFKALGSIKDMFSHYSGKLEVLEEEIKNIVKYKEEFVADKNGFIERMSKSSSDKITKYLFELVSTNYTSHEVREIGEVYIDKRSSEEVKKADVLDMMAITSPAFGMFGTVLGLIVMLQNLDDPNAIGPGLSLALLTTLYGTAFANLLFSPLAKKIRFNSILNTTREQLILEGIIMVKDGRSAIMIKDQLYSFIGQGSGGDDKK